MSFVHTSDGNTSDEDESWDVAEDYLQQELELVEPIPSVQRQACVLIVGDPGTGKSTLAWSFTRFPRTNAKRYHTIAINPGTQTGHGNSIGMHFFCVPFRSGDDSCVLKGPLQRPRYDLVIYLFDVNRRDTFIKVMTKWHPVLTWYLSKARFPPTFLVGNKIDMSPSRSGASNYNQQVVWPEEGETQADALGAIRYVEVCALAEQNTRNLLVQVLRTLNVVWVPDF